eukprot:Opistho-2@59017
MPGFPSDDDAGASNADSDGEDAHSADDVSIDGSAASSVRSFVRDSLSPAQDPFESVPNTPTGVPAHVSQSGLGFEFDKDGRDAWDVGGAHDSVRVTNWEVREYKTLVRSVVAAILEDGGDRSWADIATGCQGFANKTAYVGFDGDDVDDEFEPSNFVDGILVRVCMWFYCDMHL